jgi:transposase
LKQCTYYQAQFFRLKARRGPKKAAIAVAASRLTAAYHMLKDGTFHQDLAADHFIKRDKARIAARLVKRIKDLGYGVSLTATA